MSQQNDTSANSLAEDKAAENMTEEATPAFEPTMTKISDLQRMTIDQLNQYAKNIGLKTLRLSHKITDGV